MKVNASIAALCAVFSLSACENPNTKSVATKPVATTAEDNAVINQAVASKLKDPNSIQYRNVVSYITQDRERIICGEYNAKNSFGAYTGFTPFFIRTRANAVVSSHAYNSNDHFANGLVSSTCSDAALGVVKINPDF